MRLITQKRKTKHYKCIRVKPKEKRFIFLPVVSFEHLDIFNRASSTHGVIVGTIKCQS